MDKIVTAFKKHGIKLEEIPRPSGRVWYALKHPELIMPLCCLAQGHDRPAPIAWTIAETLRLSEQGWPSLFSALDRVIADGDTNETV